MRIFCSICKDIFVPYAEVFVTNCGHLYHSSCILKWTEQHQTCPQCRSGLLDPIRVYFDIEKDLQKDCSTLEYELEKISDKLRETEQRKREVEAQNKDFGRVLVEMRQRACRLTETNDILKASIKGLKYQMSRMIHLADETAELKSEVAEWKTKVSNLHRVDEIIKCSAVEVNNLLEATPVTSLAVKQLCTYVGVLKTMMETLQSKNLLLSRQNIEFQKIASEERIKQSMNSEETVKNLKEANSALESEVYNLKVLIKRYHEKLQYQNTEPSPSTSSQNKNLKRYSFDVDLSDDENGTNGNMEGTEKPIMSPTEDKTISNWEELVYAGKASLGMKSLLKHRVPCRPLKTHNIGMSSSRFHETFAFDGLGGRKKLKLGGPTPREEFKLIKKNKATSRTLKHPSVLDYITLS